MCEKPLARDAKEAENLARMEAEASAEAEAYQLSVERLERERREIAAEQKRAADS